ncbi:MAG: hypothetical protein KGD59_00035 [Candidatus Heimdallarchaeota archaeon]|nr:hypothetical protein [Candidatus Heimdallarchaeota archaeon]MBY8992909.1 hypothetical protein [Candidatus Heimdallarchaeota archaeon]
MKNNHSSNWAVSAHITGLFQIVENDDPLKMGSRGAGFSIGKRVVTRITQKESNDKNHEVYFNEQVIDGIVSLEVAKSFQERISDLALKIEHKSPLPIQAGFGTSGAGALGTAFALNELFETKKSDEELGQIAHKAEVICRTGLGDVISQLQGGAEIRLEPGAPGVGVIKEFSWPIDDLVLLATIETMSTKDIITSPKMIEKINRYSNQLLLELNENPTLEEFLRVSFEFADKTGLMSNKLRKLITYLREDEYSASMVMLGDSLFVVGDIYDLEECSSIIDNYDPNAKIWIDSISNLGPIILDTKIFD